MSLGEQGLIQMVDTNELIDTINWSLLILNEYDEWHSESSRELRFQIVGLLDSTSMLQQVYGTYQQCQNDTKSVNPSFIVQSKTQLIFQIALVLIENNRHWQALKILRRNSNFFSDDDQKFLWALSGVALSQHHQASYQSIYKAAQSVRVSKPKEKE